MHSASALKREKAQSFIPHIEMVYTNYAKTAAVAPVCTSLYIFVLSEDNVAAEKLFNTLISEQI